MQGTVTLNVDINGVDLVLSGSTLPLASEEYRKKIFVLLGDIGVEDKVFMCTKNKDETYSWKPLIGFVW